MTWFFWAVMASLSAAAMVESNRKFMLEPQLLNAWRSTFAVILIALSIPLMSFPDLTNVKFYTISALDGVVNAIGMALLLALSARKTGRVTSMMLPVAAIGAYATWWLANPHMRPALVEQPMQVITAVFSILTIFMALQRIRANDNSWESFIIVLPVGIAFGILDAFTSFVLQSDISKGQHYGLGLSFTLISMILCALVAWVAALPTPTGGRVTKFFDRKMLWGGFWCGFWTAGMFLGLTFSLSLASNPVFPNIVMALTPVWLLFWNYLRRTPDDASPIPSFLIILGAIGLLLSTL